MPSTTARVPVLAWLVFAGACAVQLYGLYAPQAPGPPGPPGSDKIAHALLFGAVVLAGSLVRLALRPLAIVLSAHAVLSETVQHVALPGRTGDPADVLADLVGVALGCAAVLAARRYLGGRGDRTRHRQGAGS